MQGRGLRPCILAHRESEDGPMHRLRYVARRLAMAVLVLVSVSIITFFIAFTIGTVTAPKSSVFHNYA